MAWAKVFSCCLSGLDSERAERRPGKGNFPIARFIEFSDDMPTFIAADFVSGGAGSLVPDVGLRLIVSTQTMPARNAGG